MGKHASTSATAAGTITIGGDLTVNRLGFGAMCVTGPDVPIRESLGEIRKLQAASLRPTPGELAALDAAA